MGSKCIICGVAAALAMLAVMPTHADATLEIQGSDGLSTTIQIRGGKGRMNSAGREDYLLYDSAAKIITYVEPDQQQYTQMTSAELETAVLAAASVKQTIAPYMAGMLAGLSAEQRNMIEQRMGVMLDAPAAGSPSKPAGISVVDRGKQTTAGLQCQASSILKHGRPAAEVCMATSASGKLSSQDFVTLEALVRLSRAMANSAGGLMGGVAAQTELLSVELDGVPIDVRDIEHGKYYHVTAVSNAALSDGIFNDYGKFQKQGVQHLLR